MGSEDAPGSLPNIPGELESSPLTRSSWQSKFVFVFMILNPKSANMACLQAVNVLPQVYDW